jgi:hypothetical protein
MKGNDIHSAGQTDGNVDAEEATDRLVIRPRASIKE